MISRVKFENFKALQQVSIDLERFTVFVGANATGKTSVLEGLDLLTRLASHQHQEDTKTTGRFGRVLVGRNAPDRLLTIGASAGLSVEIAGDVAVAFKADPRGSECTYTIAGAGGIATHPQPSSSSLREVFTALEGSGLGRAMRLRLDPSRLGEPSYVDDLTPRVAADGFGLASVLAAASGGRSAALSLIEADLRRIVPRARKLITSPARVERTEVDLITVNGKTLENQVNRTYVGQRFELELDGVGHVPADMLSEGTLLVLGLLTVLHTTPGLRLLLLDDLDRGLHPNAQRDVVRSLRAVLDADPQLQVVCTTHSPYALDGFEPGEVRVMQIDKNGKAGCKALTDHPDWPRWKDFMNPGEFWSSVGEDWIFGERDGTA